MPNEIIWEFREVTSYREDWMLVVILISFVLVAFVRIKNSDSFATLISSIFLPTIMSKESAGQVGWTDTEKMILLAVYFLSSSLLFTLILKHFYPDFAALSSSIAFFELFILLGSVAFFIRLGILWAIELIIGNSHMIKEYSFSVGQNNRFLGLIYIPLCLLVVLFSHNEASILLYTGVVIFGIMYLLRIFRIIVNSLKIEGGFFYIILYLCTFEFLPFIITFHYVKLILKG